MSIRHFSFTFLVVVVFLSTEVSIGDNVANLLSQCCNVGVIWANNNQPCDGHPTPIPRIERQHQAICMSTLSICCLRTYRSRMCAAGIESAKISPRCLSITKIGGEYHKDCCDACKLGIAIRGQNDTSSCQITSFEFGSPWEDAFQRCCLSGFNGTANENGGVGGSLNTVFKRNTTTTVTVDTHSVYNTLHYPRPLPVESNVNALDNGQYGTVAGTSLSEIGECSRFPKGQLCDHECVDTPQGYYCECRPGHRLNADGKSCTLGTDRCSLSNPCDHLCKDTGDAVLCSCRPGYQLKNDGRNCEDIDECFREIDDCDRITERCVNTVGGYSCSSRLDGGSDSVSSDYRSGNEGISDAPQLPCPLGYEFSQRHNSCQDSDECALGTDVCEHGSQFCTNTIGSYVCVTKQSSAPCPPGYKYNDATSLCTDVDECAEGLDACNRQREFCLNLVGTYECQPKTGSTCPAGYKYNALLQTCEDVDECSEKLHNCEEETESCRNVVGAYECDVKCEQGHRFDIAFRVCEDIDECLEGLHNCDLNTEICVNTQGDYECTTSPSAQCKAGYKPENGGCVDVDECAEQLDTCNRETEICLNDVGLYRCRSIDEAETPTECPEGYRYDPSDTHNCADINECEDGTHNCYQENTICINVIGSYVCEMAPCQAGYTLNLTMGLCQDVDECLEQLSNCSSASEDCLNTDGGFECRAKDVECPVGHHYDVSERRCKDIDECELQLDNCNRSIEICFNTHGGFRCWQVQCPAGYRPNMTARTCEDIDECAEGLHSCSSREMCVNNRGRFSCVPTAPPSCPFGHRYDSSSSTCQDIDECEENLHSCDPANEECRNTPGGYQCTVREQQQRCPPGYRMDVSVNACADVNECVEKTHDCDTQTSECRNTHGGFVCQEKMTRPSCAVGFSYSDSSKRCLDVDECNEGSDTCDRERETCINTVGGFTCAMGHVTCPPGHRFNARTKKCEDVDECAENSHHCRNGIEQCHNYAGGFRCLSIDYGRRSRTEPRTTTTTTTSPTQSCSTGYEYSEVTGTCIDVNECQVGSHSCLSTQRCDNTIGSFTCIRLTGCGTGYTLNAHSSHCEDDDECQLGTHNCGPAYQCRNTLGSFRCDRKVCPTGHQLVADGSCIHIDCGAGFQPDASGQCVDVNECDTPNICRTNQRCINVVGSYNCQNLINCGGGYELDQLGSRCIDIDECSSGTHDCRGNQQCINRQGGYICQCPSGFSLNSLNECEDLDECVRYHGKACSSNSVCRNTPGSFVCDCNEGFQHGENNRTCIDVDECQQFGTICQHTCINTWGSYQCTCLPGYTQGTDKRTCNDVDECELYKGRGNLCVGICVNEPGSFSCSCPPGYKLSADKRTCQDVDECQQDFVCKGEDQTCLNTRGSYKCNTLNCPPNYIRDVNHKNRCKRESTVCRHDDEDCIKQPLSYSFNYLTFVSRLPIPPAGHVNLFTMRGPPFSDLTSEFSLELLDARAPLGIVTANRDYFQLRRTSFNQAVISLVKTIDGPQEIELNLTMNLYRGSVLGGTALAKIFIYVSEYEF